MSVPAETCDSTVTDRAIQALFRQRPDWAQRIILAGVRGSDAHGTKLPESHPKHVDDTDTFGVSVQPVEWYLSLASNGKARQSWDTAGARYDHLIHDVRKFFALLIKGNPNVHCWLWADPADIRALHPVGQLILDRREEFLSRSCFTALAGYAKAQMHKMDRKRYQGYQGEKRKALVDEHGYDVKHAAHCIRLLNMGVELAKTGRMSSRRPPDEAALLMEIKAGEWSFRRTERHALDCWARFKDSEGASRLPDQPDRDELNALLVDIVRRVDTTGVSNE